MPGTLRRRTRRITALAAAYPGDQATGYGLGDLRGVIRVEIDRP